MVTSDEVETFWRDGVVCLRGVLPSELLGALAEPVEQAIAGEQSADLSALAGAAAGQARFVAGVDHWRAQPELRAFACDSPLPATVAAILRSTAVWLYEGVWCSVAHVALPRVLAWRPEFAGLRSLTRHVLFTTPSSSA